MSPLATGWSRLRTWSASHGPELRLCVRSTTAAVVTLAAAQLLNLPIALMAIYGSKRTTNDAVITTAPRDGPFATTRFDTVSDVVTASGTCLRSSRCAGMPVSITS